MKLVLQKLWTVCNPFEWGPGLALQKRARSHYYQQSMNDPAFATKVLQRYLPGDVLERKGAALDVGCGDGRITAMLHQLGFRVTGLDIRSSPLWAQQEAKFIEADAQNLPFEDETFDLCISFLALGYVPNDRQAIAEMARVLRPGGVLFLQLTNRKNLYSLLHRRKLDPQHLREYAVGDIHRLLRRKFTITRQWSEKVYAPFFTRFWNYCYELILNDYGKKLVTSLVPETYRGYINALAVKR